MYATIAECSTYADGSLQHASVWAAADTQTRTRALTTATRRIDTVRLLLIESPLQQAIKDACCEEALFLLAMTPEDIERERLMAIGMVGRSAGDANEHAQQSVVQARATGGGGLLSPAARGLVAPLQRRRVAVV